MKLDFNDIMQKFYETDEELAEKRIEQLKVELEYAEEWDKRLLGSGMATMALKEAEVRGALRESGVYLKKAELELEVRILQTRWYTLKQIMSGIMYLEKKENYG